MILSENVVLSPVVMTVLNSVSVGVGTHAHVQPSSWNNVQAVDSLKPRGKCLLELWDGYIVDKLDENFA